MIIPNKVLNFENSLISKLPKVIKEIMKEKTTVYQLYIKTKSYINDIDEFILIIELLYLLDKIIIDDSDGELHYVEEN